MKAITPILFILLSIGLFVTVISSNNEQSNALKEQEDALTDVWESTRELANKFSRQKEIWQSVTTTDNNKLKRLLPDSVDNVRLLREISRVADVYGLGIQDINVNAGEQPQENQAANDVTQGSSLNVETGAGFGTISIGFSVNSTYDAFKRFLGSIESSLRLIDVRKLTVTKVDQVPGLLNFDLVIDTYWLR